MNRRHPAVAAILAIFAAAAPAHGAALAPVVGTPSGAVSGSYCMSGVSGTMAAGLGSNAPIASFRYGGSGEVLIRRIRFTATDGVTGFTAGTVQVQLFAARAFSASDSGGSNATLTGNNGKLLTSFLPTGVADFRVASTATLTAGTRTLDTTPLGTWISAIGTAAQTSITGLVPMELLRPEIGEQPFQLVNNEGWVLQATVPATGTWSFAVQVCWDEVSGY